MRIHESASGGNMSEIQGDRVRSAGFTNTPGVYRMACSYFPAVHLPCATIGSPLRLDIIIPGFFFS